MSKDMMSTSSDYKMADLYLQKVADVTAGVDAMRANSGLYLPKFPNESEENYKYRNQNSKLTDIFSDIVESLASKPFSKEVGLADGDAPDELKVFIEDVDRFGDHLHVFAQNVFYSGIANAIEWILVDHTKGGGRTKVEEKKLGSRPYWARYSAADMLAVYSGVVGGKEVFHYVKINETHIAAIDGKEVVTPRVRILVRDPIKADDGRTVGYGQPRFEVWDKDADSGEWSLVESGSMSISEIPLIPFYTGKRKPGTWQITQPMRKVLDLQIEHYQQETNLKSAKELTAFPMFKGEGVAPPTDENGNNVRLPVGPSTVLYAPPDEEGRHGTWGVIEINAASLKFLADEIERTERQMRDLGRQPLQAGSAGITQVAAALASQRSSSAIQVWTFALKDALENAMRYTAQWMGIDDKKAPAIYINTDFAIELGSEKGPEILRDMHRDGILSLTTLYQEFKRRSIFSPEFDEEIELRRLLDEMPIGE